MVILGIAGLLYYFIFSKNTKSAIELGINTLSSYTNNAKVVTNKVEALVELSENYQIFTMKKDDTAASTKFIQVLDGVKVPKEEENTQTETKKESFWTKFVNLFRR